MKALDFGCGYMPQRWLPGADLADCNLALDDIPKGDTRNFFIGFFGEDRLPVDDNYYDLIWYSYGWYQVDLKLRRRVAKEITRVAKTRCTLVLRDYCSYWNHETDLDVCLTAKQWKRIVETCFPEWTLDGLYVELSPDCSNIETYDTEFCIVAILKKGWG